MKLCLASTKELDIRWTAIQVSRRVSLSWCSCSGRTTHLNIALAITSTWRTRRYLSQLLPRQTHLYKLARRRRLRQFLVLHLLLLWLSCVVWIWDRQSSIQFFVRDVIKGRSGKMQQLVNIGEFACWRRFYPHCERCWGGCEKGKRELSERIKRKNQAKELGGGFGVVLLCHVVLMWGQKELKRIRRQKKSSRLKILQNRNRWMGIGMWTDEWILKVSGNGRFLKVNRQISLVNEQVSFEHEFKVQSFIRSPYIKIF